MKKRAIIIFNPKSGKQSFQKQVDFVIHKIEESGILVDSYATAYPSQGTELARVACEEHYDYIIIVGGDGTFNEVVNGMMEFEKRPTIGYIPAGTCCDIGKSLGLSKNIQRALKIILNEKPVSMDVVKANDRYFVYVSGNGAYIDISYVTDSKLKRKIGYFAYLLKGFEELLTIPKMRMTIQSDHQVYHGLYSLVLVINSKRVAGINMIYRPDLDDGLIDVVLYPYMFGFNNLLYFFSFLLPFWSTPIVKRFKTKTLEITTSAKSRWNVDGESGGVGNQSIQVCQQAIDIIVPEKIQRKYFQHQKKFGH